jgi:PST family polysaccharide transporter
LVAATIAQAALSSILLFWRMPYSVRPRFDRSAFKDLMGYGGGFTIAVIANYFARQGDNFVVGRLFGAAALGFYGKAFSLMTLPTKQFSKVMDDVLFPVLSQVQDNQQRLASGYRRGISTVALVVLPASCYAIVMAPEVIRVIYGPGWEPAVVPFQILCLSMFFRAAYKISTSIIFACGAIYNLVIVQFVYGVLVVGGAILMQRWGLAGVAVSSAFAIGVNYWLLSRTSLRLVNQPWREFGRWHVPGLLISLLMLLLLLAIAAGLRMIAAPALVVLLISALMAGVSLLLSLRFLPGEAGLWMRALITKYWGKRSSFKQSFRKALSTK